MKRLVISAGLLILLLGLSAVHVWCLHSLTEELTAALTQAQDEAEAGRWEVAAGITERAKARWMENEGYLHATLHHRDIDAVLSYFGETLAYLQGQERQPAEYAAANARLITQLELLIEGELPTWKNLL